MINYQSAYSIVNKPAYIYLFTWNICRSAGAYVNLRHLIAAYPHKVQLAALNSTAE
jgi:hypothetical protein